MKRWNEFYETMTPKKSYSRSTTSSAEPRAETKKPFSLFSRKRKLGKSLAAAREVATVDVDSGRGTNAVPAAESYVSRREDLGKNSNKTEGRTNESNFAWVD